MREAASAVRRRWRDRTLPADTLTGGSDLWKRVVRDRYLLLMLLPCILFLLTFKYIPMYGNILAFRRFDLLNPFGGEWVGLRYFEQFFSSRNAGSVIRNTFMINVWSVVFGFPAPIILALLVNEIRVRSFRKAFQVISYMPHFISVVVIAAMIHLATSPGSGFINHILGSLGFEPIYFLIEPAWFRPIYIGSGIWQEVGWSSIIYMAAIAGVSRELYEAAVVDGAGRLRQAWHVTLPGIMPAITVLFILRMGSMLSVGAEKVLLLYTPLTYDKADVLSTYLYRVGLVHANYSLATAIGLANSVVSLILIAFVNWLAKRYTSIGIW